LHSENAGAFQAISTGKYPYNSIYPLYHPKGTLFFEKSKKSKNRINSGKIMSPCAEKMGI
jgi:hypothetical protein